MASLSYLDQITESVSELLCLERKAGRSIVRDRLRFVRLLKSGAASTLLQAGSAVSFKKSWSYELWSRYKEKGITALSTYPFQGTKPRLNTENQQLFKDSLAADSTATLTQAAALIKAQSGVSYCISATWYVLRRMGIKKKTGRPCHIHHDEAAAAAFKKKHLR